MRKLIHGYYACVSYVDAQVGKVLDELDRLGLRENTVVVLWGDNGWKLGEHDAWSKFSTCELDTRVPVIISAPGMESPGSHTDALVELVDIYPTLCDLCSVDRPDFLEGASVASLLDEPARPWKTATFSQIPRNVTGRNDFAFDGVGYSIRTDRYRLTLWVRQDNVRAASLDKIENALEDGIQDEDIVAVELYDHAADPGENVNIAGNPEQKETVEKLISALMAGWRKALPARP
jgi:arylsulfatase A-like enzyme